MAFTRLTASLAIIAALADLPNATSGLTAAQLKAKFDEASGLIKTYLNSTLAEELESTTAGASGAHNIGSAAISGVTGVTVYAQLANIYAQLVATVIGTIPDGSLTDAKLSTAANQILDRLSDHLASKAPHTVSACRVYNDAVQAVAASTTTVLAFNGELYDNDTMHDTATNNTRITIKTAGKYRISAIVEFASNATGLRQVLLKVNGATFIGMNMTTAINGAATVVNASAEYNFAVNDYIEVSVFQTSGGSLNVSASSSTDRYRCEFMASLISI